MSRSLGTAHEQTQETFIAESSRLNVKTMLGIGGTVGIAKRLKEPLLEFPFAFQTRVDGTGGFVHEGEHPGLQNTIKTFQSMRNLRIVIRNESY